MLGIEAFETVEGFSGFVENYIEALNAKLALREFDGLSEDDLKFLCDSLSDEDYEDLELVVSKSFVGVFNSNMMYMVHDISDVEEVENWLGDDSEDDDESEDVDVDGSEVESVE